MTSESPASADDIAETAAQWFARMDSGEGSHADFEAWRDADPQHAVAFAKVYASMRQLEKLRGLTAPIEPLPRPTRRGFLTTGRAAAAVIGAIAIGALAINFGNSRVQAETAVGERKIVPFPDGGQVELNTNTKAAWKLDKGRRDLWLERGEVAIKVAVGAQPLRLRAGKNVAELGPGEYVARLRDQSLDLISLSGAATVEAAMGKVVQVGAHQGLLLTPETDRVRPVSPDDVNFLTGWRNDELVLNGQVLSEVVEELNRYGDKKIIIANPELGAIPVGGRFTNRDPAKLLAGLEASFGIHVTQEGHSIILSR
ncbi:DUF4880 domain-containing protein [Asticcacaulis sp. BYS171W]|uniref:DUF4880 domain-containing protein n=1 Tax=Asticcacaulis aquaticus TaxID=2984212 RepID=A0ABT5HQ07_9CAUL|nr:DUF4880 domain-containing protein [Asticcacaulis aquaticus]MDC7682158.1 DUF4880 domain-containing protein [Asticcacaulis aquaticus]